MLKEECIWIRSVTAQYYFSYVIDFLLQVRIFLFIVTIFVVGLLDFPLESFLIRERQPHHTSLLHFFFFFFWGSGYVQSAESLAALCYYEQRYILLGDA